MTSDEVGSAIDDGAATLAAVAKATRACTGCGTCLERIMGMIEERTAAQQCPLAASQLAASQLAAAEAAPMAAIGLGELLADEGDVQGAKDAFQKAIDSGHPNAALAAAAGLGMLADQDA